MKRTASVCLGALAIALLTPHVALANPIAIGPVTIGVGSAIVTLVVSLPLALLVEPAVAWMCLRDVWTRRFFGSVVLINLITNPAVVTIALFVMLALFLFADPNVISTLPGAEEPSGFVLWLRELSYKQMLVLVILPLEIAAIAVENAYLARKHAPEIPRQTILAVVVAMNIVSAVVGVAVSDYMPAMVEAILW